MQYQTPYQSIVLIGRAGTGKGTQATKLAEAFDYAIFSTGDKAREYAAQDTPLGKNIAKIHTTGWIPEWLASYIMTKALMEDFSDRGLVFESVARKPEEAKKLHEIHTHMERPYKVIYLDCDEEILKDRLLQRGREGYDTEEKIAQRNEAFVNETMHSIDFFANKNVLTKVDADQSVEKVFTDIIEAIR